MTGGNEDELVAWQKIPTRLGALHLPADWIGETGGQVVTGAPTSSRIGTYFRENVVLSTVESAGSIVADSARAIRETMSMEPWSHVVSVNPWEDGVFQRRMQFIYEIDSKAVAVTKFTATYGDTRIDLTCSAGFDVYPRLIRVFDGIAVTSPFEEVVG